MPCPRVVVGAGIEICAHFLGYTGSLAATGSGTEGPSLEFEILNIRDLGAADFQPLLRAESRAWQDELRWDYSASARLVATWLEERRLSGYALRQDGKVRGLCFFFSEGPKALIADLFAEPLPSALIDAQRLLARVLPELLGIQEVRRIEAQLPHFPFEQLNLWFRSRCFDSYVREFMAVPLRGAGAADSLELSSPVEGALSGEFMIEPWERACDREATELLYHTYRHHVDAAINEQYASLPGVSRLVENIIHHHGCGKFLSRASFAAFHRPTRKLAGILGATRVRPETAHLPQIAVAAEFQGVGVGTALLRSALKALQQEGFQEASLTVTSLNEGAVRLYRRLGFRTFRAFGAFVWQRPPTASQAAVNPLAW
jgi:ribosomal protein S18 acetylase RimI-like enzyme